MNLNEQMLQRSRDFSKKVDEDNRARDNVNAMNKQSALLGGVQMSTAQMAQAQFQANNQQQKTNDILQKTCDTLEKRNAILNKELKSSRIVNIVSVCVAVVAVITTVVNIILSIMN